VLAGEGQAISILADGRGPNRDPLFAYISVGLSERRPNAQVELCPADQAVDTLRCGVEGGIVRLGWQPFQLAIDEDVESRSGSEAVKDVNAQNRPRWNRQAPGREIEEPTSLAARALIDDTTVTLCRQYA